MTRLPISVAIIAMNEEADLPRCLASVSSFASEIVVIDSGSTDRTPEIAKQYGAKFEYRPWPGYIAQKNAALDACNQPWILALDADEAVSPELEAALRNLFADGGEGEGPKHDGYYVNRFNYYLGRWIRHCWSPEWRLRLIRRGCARWGGLDPHDKLEMQDQNSSAPGSAGGAVGVNAGAQAKSQNPRPSRGLTAKLKGNLLHYTFTSIQEHLEKNLKFARITAQSNHDAGRKFHLHQIVFLPFIAWLKIILIKQGFRDGWRGFLIAGIRYIHTFAKYAYLYQLQHLDPNLKNPDHVNKPQTAPARQSRNQIMKRLKHEDTKKK
ncbi:MAG: glycosyltransferase family 2 protein [Phycisphaerales bacterium]|nr:glycosyltransferase family 2 protein [Phycisphaerales bacterium]